VKALLVLAVVVPIAMHASCSIDHPSDALACTAQSDCESGRTCTNGYCIVANAGCPSGCTSCDLTAKTCQIDSAGNGDVTCPPGYACTITCGNNGCRNIDCKDGTSCTIACTGMKSCDQIDCSGECHITCTGSSSCANVDCRDACSCDVTCGPNTCNDLQCPSGCGNATSCSSQAASCHSC